MLDKVFFYDTIRQSIFKGKISPSQLEGMENILDEWDREALDDIRHLAYMLATTYHETAFTMQPIREWGRGKGKKYGVADPKTGHIYYGRGFVQLTWKGNYNIMGAVVKEDLVNNPDKAMEMPIATKILFVGMQRGLFTGKKLNDYIYKDKCDYVNARRIINGLDKAELIAKYAIRFEKALKII